MSWRRLGTWLTIGGLVACARSPDPRMYMLTAEPGRAEPATRCSVEVRRPSLSRYLDRREMVRAVIDHRLELQSDAIWAEPLAAMLGRVLTQDLALRLPNARVYSEESQVNAPADVAVQVDLQRFEQTEDRGVLLRALVSLQPAAPDAAPALRQLEHRAPLSDRGTDAQVAALTRLSTQLADDVAGMLEKCVQNTE